MRFYHLVTLALALICLFGDGGEGSPTGNYMWVKCKPDSKDANCITQKGPVIPLKGQKPRLPPSAVKDIVPVTKEEATPEMLEESGDGSGDSDTFPLLSQRSARGAPELDGNKIEEEGSTFGSGDIDYSEYVSPQKINALSTEDLEQDNFIA